MFTFWCAGANAQDAPVNFSFIDSTVNPGDDFYRFANGRWLKTATIPPNQGMWGPIVANYEKNADFIEKRIRELANESHKVGSAEQLLGDFYASGLDTALIEKLGSEPLGPYLKAVDRIKSRRDVSAFIARHIMIPTNALINLYAEPDAHNNQIQLATLGSAGLAFGASYYLGKDAKSLAMRDQYREYLTQILGLVGYDRAQAATAAGRILDLELRLAEAYDPPGAVRQSSSSYNLTTVSKLDRTYPNTGWQSFFTLTQTRPKRVNVTQPRYYRSLDSLLAIVPIVTWRDKLKADYITAHAVKLSRPFRNAHFAFFGKALAGQQQPEPRSQAIMNRITYPLRDLVGQIYVRDHFSETAKKDVTKIFDQIQTVYAQRLQAASWLSDGAKREALRKLHKMAKKIGYPDQWESYGDNIIQRDDFFGNTVRLSERNRAKNLQQFDQPMDKTIWRFMIAGLGASYSDSENAITLTAGYLQPPYFWSSADDAVKYATIGRTIGHELTHAFDSKGYRYDADGNLKTWFSSADSTAFVGRYEPLMNQFSQYIVLDSIKNDGKKTIGENIADLVGLSVAYEAFTGTSQFKQGVEIDGLTPTQRFFLAYAQEHRTIYTPQMIRVMLQDAHPLEEFRVNGTLSNFTPFYEAFGVKPTDKLYRQPESRAIIW